MIKYTEAKKIDTMIMRCADVGYYPVSIVKVNDKYAITFTEEDKSCNQKSPSFFLDLFQMWAKTKSTKKPDSSQTKPSQRFSIRGEKGRKSTDKPTD
jgi:hypothetical protein